MKKLLLATIAAMLLTAPAAAADLPIKAPPRMVAAPVFSWTGFYIGAHVGYAWGRANTVVGFPDALDCGASADCESISHDVSGIFGGGHIGYNWQFNWAVIGIEAEGGYIDADGSRFSAIEPDHRFSTQYGAYGAFTGRVGVAFGRTLFYGKAGGVVAEIKNEALDDFPTIDPDHIGRSSKARWGWTAGAGIEHAFGNNWTARIEYLYMDFDSVRVFDLGDGGDGPVSPYDFKDRLHTVRFGLSYKFGGPFGR